MKTDKVKRRRGRPKVGVRRSLSVTLPESEWEKVDAIVSAGYATTPADYFRQLHDLHQANKMNNV